MSDSELEDIAELLLPRETLRKEEERETRAYIAMLETRDKLSRKTFAEIAEAANGASAWNAETVLESIAMIAEGMV